MLNEVTMVTQSENGKSPGILPLDTTPTQERRPEARIQILGNHIITTPPPGGILEQEAHHIQGLMTQYAVYLREGTSRSGWDLTFVNALRRLRPPSVPKNRRCRIRLTDGWEIGVGLQFRPPGESLERATLPWPRINNVPPVCVVSASRKSMVSPKLSQYTQIFSFTQIMNPWRNMNTTPWSSECEGATEYWKAIPI
ncbi:hypothetical protein JTB14_004831 [Gonioctena quinquepunctata]|nr:hypothetical protein JTB14_004831 [Gonioctena quinquepunctata]